MKLLLGIFSLGLAIVFGGALVNPIVERWQDSNAYARQLESLQLQQKQLDLQQYAAEQPARITSNYGFTVLALLLGVVALFIAYDTYRQRRQPLVRFAGQLVPRALVESGDPQLIGLLADQIRASGIAQIAAAQRPNVPHVFSPHYSNRSADLALPGELVSAPAMLASSTAPTFAALLDSGRVGKGNPLVLGFSEEDSSEVSGSWLDLYSTAIGGMPGTGKTTTQRFLACQTALQGARFAVIDPHAGATDDSLAATLAPLSSAFLAEPASDDKEILETVRMVADIGARRVKGQDSDITPIVLWVDELTALLGRSTVAEPLAELLERVAQEYRKRHVFVCASGQIWTASRTTSELRDSFASAIVHRMKRGQARMLLPTSEAGQVERLQTGHAVLWRTSGATSAIVIPNTSGADVERVGALLSGYQPATKTATSDRAFGFQPVAKNKPLGSHLVATEDRLPSASVSPEARRAADMFLRGLDPAAIVLELRGVKSSEGGKYQRALAEILDLIRLGMGGAAKAAA